MLTISLHQIRIHAPIGLYDQEKITGNDFETDVDIHINAAETEPFPFIDYVRINHIVQERFIQPYELLETLVRDLYRDFKEALPDARRIRICVRKLHPPLGSDIAYAQVCFDR